MVENKLDFEQLDNYFADYFYLCHHFYFPKHIIQGKQQLHHLKFFFSIIENRGKI